MNSTKSKVTGCILGLALLLAGGQSAHSLPASWDASFTPSGWTRGATPGSLYSEWNFFNDDIPAGNGRIQDTSPEVANFGGGTYQVAETTGAAFLTSGGNIYSPVAPTAFEFTVGNVAGGLRDVYLRLASVGNFNPTVNGSFTNFQLNGINGVYSLLHNEAIVGGFGGNEVEGLVSFLGVPGAASFLLTWNAVGSSVSLDQLSLDVGSVAPVPLPAAVYLMGSGLAGIAAMARRRQRAV